MRTRTEGDDRPFYRRYLGAFLAAAVFGTLGLLVQLTTTSNLGGAARVGEVIFGFLALGTMAFLVAWVVTLLAQLVRQGIDSRRAAASSHQPPRARPARTNLDLDIDGHGIFVSYRRQDEPNFTGRLADRLAAQFGKGNVFMDVDSIGIGVDFERAMERSLSHCEVMIVIIGRNWADTVNTRGERRLADPEDYVRREIEAALASKTPVIPVLAEGAAMPDRSSVPESLVPLTRYTALEMSHARFSIDVGRLFDAIEPILRFRP